MLLKRAEGSLENLPGNGNTVRVVARLVTGSGTRANSYRNVSGPALPANQGTGNRVEFVGSGEGLCEDQHKHPASAASRVFRSISVSAIATNESAQKPGPNQ